MNYELGIDEAGRGPVIGPMVIAGAVITEKDKEWLKRIGIKDSKLISPKKRETLYSELINKIEYKTIIIEPKEIDEALTSNSINLNWLEAIHSARIINFFKDKINKAILDCPSNNITAYKEYVSKLLMKKPELVVEHKADLNHISVSAASIIAKVTRDRIIHELKLKINKDFGSGYPSDPKTIKFLQENYNKYNFFRKTWSSWQKAATKKITSFLKND